MYRQLFYCECDNCGSGYTSYTRGQALAVGWSFERGGKHCYCPTCTTARRERKKDKTKHVTTERGAALTFGF